MSKESFIGGDYIETTGGSSKTFAKGPIEIIGSQVINEGKTNGVLIGTNKKAPNFTGAVVTFAYIAKLEKDEYHQIKWAGVEDEVYVVVRTAGLVGRTISINILDRNATITKSEYGVLSVLQDMSDKDGRFFTKVQDDGLAVFKLELQPSKVDKDIKTWREKIGASTDKRAYLCVLVDAHSQNKDLTVTYMGKNPATDKTSKKGNKTNYWLDEKGKWFELKDIKKVCPIDVNHRSHFVLHCTAGNMSESSIKEHTKFNTKSRTRSKAHKYVMPNGNIIEIWPFTEKNVWATKAESKLNLKGQMFHVEINYGSPNVPTNEQYESIAKLYIEASEVQNCWPIIVPHIEIDRGIPNGHSDPTDFEYNKFYTILKSMGVPIDEIPHFENDRYWGSPSYKIPMANDKNTWPPILKGNPHK